MSRGNQSLKTEDYW